MIKKNRLVCFVFGFLLLISACNTSPRSLAATQSVIKTITITPKSTKTPMPTKVPDIAAEEAKLNGLQIRFLHPWTGNTEAEIDSLVDEFNQSNVWKIHVIAQAAGSYSMFKQVFEENLEDETSINLVASPLDFLTNSDQKNNNIVDLNPYIYSTQYGLSEDQINDYLPAFWDEDIVNGKHYGLPAQQSAAVLFYNSSWAAELGISKVPINTTEFRELVCAANKSMRQDTDKTNDSIGGWIVNTEPETLNSWFHSYLADTLEGYSNEDTEDALEYLYQLNREHCAWVSSDPQPYQYFANRQAIVYSGMLQDLMKQHDTFMKNETQDDWKIIPYPTNGKQKILTNGISYAVISGSEEQQLASWLFIRWLSTPENQARLLKTSGTLPLGSKVLSQLTDFREEYPQWNEMVSYLPLVQPNERVEYSEIRDMVIEDAVGFMFRSEFPSESIPSLLKQVDSTITELIEREP